MAVTPTIQDEVAFISSVAGDGTLASKAYYSWNLNNPATFSGLWTTARKWGGTTAGSSGGTVTYYFDPSWTPTEQKWAAAGLALWSAVANIKFTETSNPAQAKITFRHPNNGASYTYAIYTPTLGAAVTGGNILGTLRRSSINIDTTGTTFGPINGLSSQGGFAMENVLHEEGHALGLGHAGPYDGAVNTYTQQFSAFDTRMYSVMSYLDPDTSSKYSKQVTVKGTDWNGNEPTTWMPLDILAIQRLYGIAEDTPLDGGQVFGFNTNITGDIRPFFDFTQNTNPVVTIWDKGTGNTLDVSGFSQSARINLNPGTYSSTTGMFHNIAIAYDTKIDRLICGDGDTRVTCNNDGDTVIGGNGDDIFRDGAGDDDLSGGGGNDTFYGSGGSDTINGGSGSDVLVLPGNADDYNFASAADGATLITGSGIDDSLYSIEQITFGDGSVPIDSVVASANSNSSSDVTALSANTGLSADKIGWDPDLAPSGPATTSVSSNLGLNALASNTPLANADPLLSSGLVRPTTMWHATTG